jgi:hypothetical protein
MKWRSCGHRFENRTDPPMEQRVPCPSCGSMARVYEMQFSGELGFRSTLRAKARHGLVGKIKPFFKLLTGHSFWKSGGKWVHREKVEDGENDRYFELVVDPDSGQVVHRCEEPLSEHRGHGSAKQVQLPE